VVELYGDGLGNLRNVERVRQTVAKEIRFKTQTAPGGRHVGAARTGVNGRRSSSAGAARLWLFGRYSRRRSAGHCPFGLSSSPSKGSKLDIASRLFVRSLA